MFDFVNSKPYIVTFCMPRNVQVRENVSLSIGILNIRSQIEVARENITKILRAG